jgi:GTP cyclohydrolase I
MPSDLAVEHAEPAGTGPAAGPGRPRAALRIAGDGPPADLAAAAQAAGVAHVGYLPGERILGLSKLARLVEHFAARPQTQERLTRQVAEALVAHVDPRGAGVLPEAEHSCMTQRGVRALGAKTVTSSLPGTLHTDPRSRAEFRALAGVPG